MKDKETIIKKLKDNRNLVLILFTILISGLTIGVLISKIDKPIKNTYYIAMEDAYIKNAYHTTHNTTSLHIKDNFLITLIKFDFTDKPKHWEKCEISFYVYYIALDMLIYCYLTNYTWSENITYNPIWSPLFGYGQDYVEYEGYYKIKVDYNLNSSSGFKRIDISKYIKDNKTLSLEILGGHISGVGTTGGDIRIYSKEADVSIEYKPQLIWS